MLVLLGARRRFELQDKTLQDVTSERRHRDELRPLGMSTTCRHHRTLWHAAVPVECSLFVRYPLWRPKNHPCQ